VEEKTREFVTKITPKNLVEEWVMQRTRTGVGSMLRGAPEKQAKGPTKVSAQNQEKLKEIEVLRVKFRDSLLEQQELLKLQPEKADLFSLAFNRHLEGESKVVAFKARKSAEIASELARELEGVKREVLKSPMGGQKAM